MKSVFNWVVFRTIAQAMIELAGNLSNQLAMPLLAITQHVYKQTNTT
ncbi:MULTISPECIES: hypothetical protein [Fischerella]|nr:MULTISPECIES: hypothetical protein [Fischerella]MBD2432937.1 hypothetical protein [Fischerella sp. FACHB-380]